MKILIYIASILGIAFIIFLATITFFGKKEDVKDIITGGFTDKGCQTSSSTQYKLTTSDIGILSTSSRRAFARIALQAATSSAFLNFENDSLAVNFNDTYLNGTSTPFIDFGLNTFFPYTGAVHAIAPTANVAISVTECTY